jgi:hypothetical protein
MWLVGPCVLCQEDLPSCDTCEHQSFWEGGLEELTDFQFTSWL